MDTEYDGGTAPRAGGGQTRQPDGTAAPRGGERQSRQPDGTAAARPGSGNTPRETTQRASAAQGAGSVQRRRAGRPRTAVLSAEQITTAALDVINERGYEALTMSALASRLGVAPSALYNHVSNKQQLLAWVEDAVMDEVDYSGFGTLPVDEALRRWAASYRNVFARHAPLIPVIAVLPVGGAPKTVEMYEAVAAGMAAAGWERSRIIPAIVALESFIFGSALDATAPRDIFDAAEGRGDGEFATALQAQRETGADPADAAFHAGLDALLAGLGPSAS